MNAMNLLDMVMQAQGGKPTSQPLTVAGKQFGLNKAQSQSAAAALLPAISSALKQNTSSPQGLAGLLGALQNGQHSQYLDNAASLKSPDAMADGNAILGHLFGSKDVSRNVAAHAAQQTGLDVSALKKMLPMVATMAMGALSKQTQAPSMQSQLTGMAMQQLMGGNSGGLGGLLGAVTGAKRKQQQAHQQGLGLLGRMLDADGDGNLMDDVLNMAMNKR